MKTISNITKTFVKTTLVMMVLTFMITSCGSDDDGNEDSSDDDFVTLPSASASTYTGTLTYTGSTGTIVVPEGATATISGQSSNYSISFSDGVPTIGSLQFVLLNGVYVTTGSSNIVIRIEDDELTVQAQNNGDNWVFDGDR